METVKLTKSQQYIYDNLMKGRKVVEVRNQYYWADEVERHGTSIYNLNSFCEVVKYKVFWNVIRIMGWKASDYLNK